MPDVAINVQQVQAAGQGYTVPNSIEMLLKSARAAFDGSGAGGSYVPTLRLVSDAGLVVAECPIGATVAAGASADVTWFPGVAEAPASSGGGIQYDTDPQGTGHWLWSETTVNRPGGVGLDLRDSSSGGINVQADANTGAIFLTTVGNDPAADIALFSNQDLNLHGDKSVLIQTDSGPNGITIQSQGGDVLIQGNANQDVTVNAPGATGRIVFQLAAAGALFVAEDAANSPIFEVREDGTIHGRAAVGAITWDL